MRSQDRKSDPRMHTDLIVSVIVVTLNERQHIPRLADALRNQNLPPGVALETILVDGGSSDGTPEEAERCGFSRVIALPGASIPKCRNAGLAAAAGEWIGFLDGDCEPASDWILTAAPYLQGNEPVMVGWPAEPPLLRTWVQEAWHLHWRTKGTLRRKDPEPFRLITTRNMLFNRAALHLIGDFDEDLPTGEDTHFALRAWAAGVHLIPLPQLRVIHHGEPATLKDFFRQQLWHANRRAYRKIVRATRLRHGGHAPLYAAIFLAALVMVPVGALCAFLAGRPLWMLVALVPLLSAALLPAVLTSLRARRPVMLIPLTVIYAAYGTARALDLLGFARSKRSWKTR